MIKIKQGKKTITNDVAYIAGFFDGEGCVRLKQASQGGNSYMVWVSITNSNNGILEYISNFFGGKVRKAEKTPNKTIYHLVITCVEGTDFLKTIIGFLKEKRTQAELAIYFQEHKETLTPEKKRLMYEQMKKLKL